MRFEESELETLKQKNKDLEAENNNLHEQLMKVNNVKYIFY